MGLTRRPVEPDDGAVEAPDLERAAERASGRELS